MSVVFNARSAEDCCLAPVSALLVRIELVKSVYNSLIKLIPGGLQNSNLWGFGIFSAA